MIAANAAEARSEPSTRDEIEAALRAKYEAGDLRPGLFATSVSWVVMREVSGALVFEWFEHAVDLGEALGLA